MGYSGRQGIQSTWRCRCECGQEKPHVLYNALVSGMSNSCGCLRSEQLKGRRKHGQSNSKIYHAWQQMKDRCLNTERRAYKDYGGRGIAVCPRWLESFENFLADLQAEGLADPPYGAVFDRKDNERGYEPGNMRWVDSYASNKNKRTTRWYEWKGKQRTLTDIARMENVCYLTFRQRMCWPTSKIEQALEVCRKRGLVYKERSKGKRPE